MRLKETLQSHAHLDYVSSKLRICALKKYIYGLKSFNRDKYYEDNSEVPAGVNSPVYACSFGRSPSTLSLLALVYEDGRVILQQTISPLEGNYVVNKKIHENAIFGVSWVCNKPEFVTAVADSPLHLWSVNEGTLSHIQQFKGHNKCVKCVDANSWDTNVFASGGRDCSIIIWDKRCQPDNKANEITDAHSSHKTFNSPRTSHHSFSSQSQNCVISVSFSEQTRLLSAGASDGLIKIWDLRKTYGRGKRKPMSLSTLEHAGQSSYKGFTSMSLSPFGERVYVSCLDGNIYAYHLANPTLVPVAKYYGHKPSSYYTKCCLSQCGSYLLSGSSDDKAYIWLTRSPGLPIASLSGHLDEVTSVAWSSTNHERVVTCSDDLTHRIFKYNAQEREEFDPTHELSGFAVPFVNESESLCRNSVSSQNRHRIISPNCSVLQDSAAASNFVQMSSDEGIPGNSQSQITPLRNELRTRNSHVTPNTSERKTLLSWLSSSKTPNRTPNRTPNPESSKSPFSQTASCRSGLTPRTSYISQSNQENLENENLKPSSSPRKCVLNELKIMRNNSPANCVAAKMLKYEDVCPKVERADAEDGEHFKLFDDVEKSKVFVSSSLFSNNSTQIISDVETPVKNCKDNTNLNCIGKGPEKMGLLLSSPTANLPNYLLDGRSPHCRRETPLPKKQRLDWLTSHTQKNENVQNLPSIPDETSLNCRKIVKPVNSINRKKKTRVKKKLI